MSDATFYDPEILTCLGTREQDVADSSWPEIRKGQRILEDAFTRASLDAQQSEQVRQHVTKIMLRTKASVIRRGCQRVLDLLTQARTAP
jgi:hypothetical protein